MLTAKAESIASSAELAPMTMFVPFSLREAVLRAQAILRRGEAPTERTVYCRLIQIDGLYHVSVNGRAVHLTSLRAIAHAGAAARPRAGTRSAAQRRLGLRSVIDAILTSDDYASSWARRGMRRDRPWFRTFAKVDRACSGF